MAPIQRPDWTQLRHESWTNPKKLANMAKLAESTASLVVVPSSPITSTNKSGAARLAEAKERVLQALDAAEDVLTPLALSKIVGITKTATSVYLTEMQEAGLVRPRLRTGPHETPWRISERGQAYLVAHGLA